MEPNSSHVRCWLLPGSLAVQGCLLVESHAAVLPSAATGRHVFCWGLVVVGRELASSKAVMGLPESWGGGEWDQSISRQSSVVSHQSHAAHRLRGHPGRVNRTQGGGGVGKF